jgi:hypothetical protein
MEVGGREMDGISTWLYWDYSLAPTLYPSQISASLLIGKVGMLI